MKLRDNKMRVTKKNPGRTIYNVDSGFIDVDVIS